MATITKHKRWTLVPILNDDSGKVDYWDVYEPCRFRCEQKVVVRLEGSPDRAKCECWYASEPDHMAGTLVEAKQIVENNARKVGSWQAFDRMISGE